MKPERYEYYGFPVFYRTEKRKVGTSLILSFREESTGESTKRAVHLLYECTPIVIEKDIAGGMSIEKIIEQHVPNFLREMYSHEIELPLEYQRESQKLPFAVVWELNREMMVEKEAWAKGTEQEYARSAEDIKTRWGNLPFSNLTPSFCAHELSRMSHRKEQNTSALLRKLWDYEAADGYASANPWVNYTTKARRDPMTPKKSKSKNIVRTCFSKEQSRIFATRCIEGISVSGYGSYYLAALIHFENRLTFEEICALRYESVQKLVHYRKCYVLNVTKQAVKHGERHSHENIANPAKIRGIPLSSPLEGVLNKYIKEVKATGKYHEDNPLIRNPKNMSRVANPSDLKKWINKTFRDLADQCNQGVPIKDKMTASELLTNTAKQHLYDSGLDDEELRYVLGLKPQETYAKFYCDFGNEAERNKIKAFLDKNANIYFPMSESILPQPVQKLRSEEKPCIWRNTEPDNRTEVDITFELPPLGADKIPEKGIILMLFAQHGARMNLCYVQR